MTRECLLVHVDTVLRELEGAGVVYGAMNEALDCCITSSGEESESGTLDSWTARKDNSSIYADAEFEM